MSVRSERQAYPHPGTRLTEDLSRGVFSIPCAVGSVIDAVRDRFTQAASLHGSILTKQCDCPTRVVQRWAAMHVVTAKLTAKQRHLVRGQLISALIAERAADLESRLHRADGPELKQAIEAAISSVFEGFATDLNACGTSTEVRSSGPQHIANAMNRLQAATFRPNQTGLDAFAAEWNEQLRQFHTDYSARLQQMERDHPQLTRVVKAKLKLFGSVVAAVILGSAVAVAANVPAPAIGVAAASVTLLTAAILGYCLKSNRSQFYEPNRLLVPLNLSGAYLPHTELVVTVDWKESRTHGRGLGAAGGGLAGAAVEHGWLGALAGAFIGDVVETMMRDPVDKLRKEVFDQVANSVDEKLRRLLTHMEIEREVQPTKLAKILANNLTANLSRDLALMRLFRRRIGGEPEKFSDKVA